MTLVALSAAAAFAAPAGAAPSLEAFALSAGGVSGGGSGGCTTFLAPAPVGAFFGGGMGLPLDGLAACNVAGDLVDATSVTGPITGSRTLSSSWPDGIFSGAAVSQAGYGTLSASGHSVFSGTTSSTTVTGSESFGRCNDSFTITSPSVADGQPGTVRFMVTIVGGLSTSASGSADVELNYQIGPSNYSMFRSVVNNAAEVPFIHSIFGVGVSGFTATPGAMSGSGEPTTFAHAIVFGTPFELDLGLFAYTIPGGSSTVDAHFEAHVSGVEVTGPGGQVLSDFVASAASGTSYGPGGTAAVGAGPGHEDAVRLTAYPNPTTSGARLSFSLPQHASARLGIYDAAGRQVRALRAGHGASQLAWWDGRDERGALLPGGTYYARLSWAEESRTTRVTLVR